MNCREAMPRACALCTALATCVLWSSFGTADEMKSAVSSPSALKLWRSAQNLAVRSRAVRITATSISERQRQTRVEHTSGNRGPVCSANFSVWAPAVDGLAEDVLAAAERYRGEVALAWLGEALPVGRERTMIHVDLTDDRDVGLAMLAEGQAEQCNRIWLKTSPHRAVGTTLAHEIAHIVLSARFPADMPAWANEGIACQYDDEARITRRAILRRQFVTSGRWPSLTRLFTADAIVPTNEPAYAAAVSVTKYLVRHADRPTFLAFVADGQTHEWDAALQRHYGLASIQDLESCWRADVIAELSVPQHVTKTQVLSPKY